MEPTPRQVPTEFAGASLIAEADYDRTVGLKVYVQDGSPGGTYKFKSDDARELGEQLIAAADRAQA